MHPLAAGLLDSVKDSSASANQQVSQALDQAQILLDALKAVPAAVAGISRSVKDAIDMLRDTFREVRGRGGGRALGKAPVWLLCCLLLSRNAWQSCARPA